MFYTLLKARHDRPALPEKPSTLPRPPTTLEKPPIGPRPASNPNIKLPLQPISDDACNDATGSKWGSASSPVSAVTDVTEGEGSFADVPPADSLHAAATRELFDNEEVLQDETIDATQFKKSGK